MRKVKRPPLTLSPNFNKRPKKEQIKILKLLSLMRGK